MQIEVDSFIKNNRVHWLITSPFDGTGSALYLVFNFLLSWLVIFSDPFYKRKKKLKSKDKQMKSSVNRPCVLTRACAFGEWGAPWWEGGSATALTDFHGSHLSRNPPPTQTPLLSPSARGLTPDSTQHPRNKRKLPPFSSGSEQLCKTFLSKILVYMVTIIQQGYKEELKPTPEPLNITDQLLNTLKWSSSAVQRLGAAEVW